jgi:hypothetical protein
MDLGRSFPQNRWCEKNPWTAPGNSLSEINQAVSWSPTYQEGDCHMHNNRPLTLSATTMIGDEVKNPAGEKLGEIEEIMLDVGSGRISYAVLSFGGLLGIGDKLFAIPWPVLKLDASDHSFIVNVPKDRLEQAPGFDEDDWPDMANPEWGRTVHRYYDVEPYWN